MENRLGTLLDTGPLKGLAVSGGEAFFHVGTDAKGRNVCVPIEEALGFRKEYGRNPALTDVDTDDQPSG